MSDEERLDAVKQKVTDLKSQIDAVKEEKNDKTMGVIAAAGGPLKEFRKPPSIKLRRHLKGHFGKVYAMHWAGSSDTLVSASQDGKLIVWNAFTNLKTNAVALRSSWVMSCAFEQSRGNLIACGGLDNLCSIYNISDGSPQVSKADKELAAHDGYLSCCRFIDETKILTSSGDSSCLLWDTQTGEILQTFSDHKGDVMSVSLCPSDPNVFVSGSVDTTARIWDIRTGKNVQTHVGHESDINAVDFFPDGKAFGTGSDDSTCRLFDMRSYGEVNKFGSDTIKCGITSVTLGKSGRLIFAGYDDYNVHAWDTLSSGDTHAFQLPSPHENRVSCLGINPAGDALCTGSWDTHLKIWA